MTKIAKTDERWNGGPGTWFLVRRENGELSAMLNCPTCGKTAGLSHAIDVNGVVIPSVVCPYGCGFHDYVTLVDWASP